MARYRVIGERAFLKPAGHLTPVMVEVGEEIVFLGRPGLSLQPLDEAAVAAKLASIPKYLHGNNAMVFRLARSLGAPEVTTWTEARAFIHNWIKEHRESADV